MLTKISDRAESDDAMQRACDHAYKLADPPRRGGYVVEVFERGGVEFTHRDTTLRGYEDEFGALFVADDDGIAALEADGDPFQIVESYGYREEDDQ